MHVHQKLDRGETPLFYDERAPYARLSELGVHYTCGLLTHGRALTGLTNPSTNSFKRLVPGYEAPVNLFYSLGNRSAAVRIPKYATQPHEKRIEYRPPDFTGNIYLTLAAMLMAGIDGIRKKIDPARHHMGPYDVDMAHAAPDLRARVAPIPTSVEGAMQALRDDRQFLLLGGVFTEDLLDAWIDLKQSVEAAQIAARPHPYEFNLYLDA